MDVPPPMRDNGWICPECIENPDQAFMLNKKQMAWLKVQNMGATSGRH